MDWKYGVDVKPGFDYRSPEKSISMGTDAKSKSRPRQTQSLSRGGAGMKNLPGSSVCKEDVKESEVRRELKERETGLSQSR